MDVYSLLKASYVVITGFLVILLSINFFQHRKLEKQVLNAIILLPLVLRMLLIK